MLDDFGLLESIRWEAFDGAGDNLAVDLTGLTAGQKYKLTLLFSDSNSLNRVFDINLKETIIFGVTPAAILADPAAFGALITRGPPGTGAPCAGCPGPIIDIDQRNINLGQQKVRGLDTDFRFRFPAAGLGTFTVGMNGTYIDKYVIQGLDGSFSSINGSI